MYEDHDFGWALEQLRAGERVARDGWNGKGMWVALSPGFQLPPEAIFSEPVAQAVAEQGEDGEFLPYLMLRTVNGEFVPWLASQTDILAEDWALAAA